MNHAAVSSRKKIIPLIFQMAIATLSGTWVPAAQVLNTASMNWSSGRSDWINVKTAYGAIGDGITDDTVALQNALNAASANLAYPKTVYLPPGIYKISSTLYWHTPLSWTGTDGLSLIGSGGDPARQYSTHGTMIKWAMTTGQPMFSSTGASRSRYFGIVWNGNSSAKCAYLHSNTVNGQYETRIRHENEAFLNFDAPGSGGIISGDSSAVTAVTAETMIWNCLFYRCSTGVVIGAVVYNYYFWMFDGCEFEECGTGINSAHGKAVVTNTHFAGSAVVDIYSEYAIRVRHCTSVGSKSFFSGTSNWNNLLLPIFQDCFVDSWTDPAGAIIFKDRGPGQIFDCVFTTPPSGNAPICVATNSSVRVYLLLSGNYSPSTSSLVRNLTGVMLDQVTIPDGRRVSSLCSAKQTFLKSVYPPDGPIIDVTLPPYNANNNSSTSDDAPAIQNAISAANSANNGSIVYLPAGGYHLDSSILVGGSNYSIQGSGFQTQLLGYGSGSLIDPVIAVNNASGVALSQFTVKTQNSTITKIRQTSVPPMPNNISYDGIYGYQFTPANPNANTYSTDAGLALSSLPTGSIVYLRHLDMSLAVQDCGAARILADYVDWAQVKVSGSSGPKTGFLGISALEISQNEQTKWSISVDDNQNLVIGDYYTEASYGDISIRGGAGVGPGKVAIQSMKESCLAPATEIGIDNYGGNIFYGGTWLKACDTPGMTTPASITQTGSNACSLTLAGINFYLGLPTISVTSTCAGINLMNTAFEGTSTVYLMNQTPTGWQTAAASGLDYLRELGSVSLSTKYNLIQGVVNPGAELDAPNPSPSAATGYNPPDWALTGAGAYGTGVRNVTTLGQASPFASGSQGMLFVDNTGSSAGDRLFFSQTFGASFDKNLGAVFSFDFRLNSAGSSSRLVARAWANGAEGCDFIVETNGTAGSLWAKVGGVTQSIGTLALDTWYRARAVMASPSAGPGPCILYLTPWVGTSPGTTTNYSIDGFGSAQTSGFNKVSFNTITPGQSCHINLDNITLKTGITNIPALP